MPQPTTRVMPSTSPRSATPRIGCAALPTPPQVCRCRSSGRSRNMREKPIARAAPSPNCSGRNDHEPDRRHPPVRCDAATDTPHRRHRQGAAGVGCAQPRHGPRLHHRRQAHRRSPAALRRTGPLLLNRTAELSGERPDVVLEPEATVFTNIAPGSADVVRPWVEALRNVGFAVFAKPKIDEDSDVDSDMLDHIALRRSEGLASVLVASADGQAFKLPLEEIARDGVPVQVLGFREHASWALASDTLEFVDLEDIPGVFREPLPRIGLDSLPEQGAWLQPFRPLSSLLTSRV